MVKMADHQGDRRQVPGSRPVSRLGRRNQGNRVKRKDNIKLYDLIETHDPHEVWKEIVTIISLLESNMIKERLQSVYEDIIRLFNGDYPGYRASNTKYHNLEHTIMVTLATARLIHGAVKAGHKFHVENILLGLLASLYHDSGLIQTKFDRNGTGAKYTIGHEERSIDFMRKNLSPKGFSERQMKDCAQLIKCTNMNIDIGQIVFRSKELKTLGKIVGSADLVAQMADRHYLEKLILLFKEFEEAGIPGFASEEELLEKTEGFYKNVAHKRLARDLENISSNMAYHFKYRWDIDRDLYTESIKNNINYLKSMLENGQKTKSSYRRYLKRGGFFRFGRGK